MSGYDAGWRHPGCSNLIGLFLVKAGGALIDNMAILFAIGVGVGMSEKMMVQVVSLLLLHGL